MPVGLEVGAEHEAVVVHQAVHQPFVAAAVVGREQPAADRLQGFLQPRRGRDHPAHLQLPGLPALLHLLGAEAEDEHVFQADPLAHLDIGAVQVPMVSAPLRANFMLLVPEASSPAVEICSERSAAGMIASARLTL